MKIVTHSGAFHTDEVFAVALLKKFVNGNIEVIRTRNNELLEEAKKDKSTYVIDVGREYNEEYRNFDHHQREFNLKWNNEIGLLSSCGLVWKYIKKKGYLKKIKPHTIKIIEETIIQKIDMHDNGTQFWTLSNIIKVCNREDNKLEDFMKAVDLAYIFLDNSFYHANNTEDFMEQFEIDLMNYDKKGIFVSSLSSNSSILNKLSKETNALVVIYEQKGEQDKESRWYTKAITKTKIDENNLTEKYSALSPTNWRGISEEELKRVSGLKGAIFAHKMGHLCVSKNRKTAEQMALKMIENYTLIHKEEKKTTSEENNIVI